MEVFVSIGLERIAGTATLQRTRRVLRARTNAGLRAGPDHPVA